MKRSFLWPLIAFISLCLLVIYLQTAKAENPGPAVRGDVYYFYPAEYTAWHDIVRLKDSTKTETIDFGWVHEDPYNPGTYYYLIGAPGLQAGHYWVIGYCYTWPYTAEYYIYHDGVHTYYQDVYFGSHTGIDGGDE